jgi:hypothetical protein
MEWCLAYMFWWYLKEIHPCILCVILFVAKRGRQIIMHSRYSLYIHGIVFIHIVIIRAVRTTALSALRRTIYIVPNTNLL